MSSRKHIHAPANVGEHIADSVTAFVGSWLCIGLHAIWFVLWIILRVEPFPYGLLTMIVSLEAIFLSTLVMISQNRQTTRDRKRDDLESQEVQSLFDNHTLLLQMNRQQIDILNQQSEILELLQGSSDEETKVCDDGQAQERSNSVIGRSSEDEEWAADQASEVTLEHYLSLFPDHPIARETEKWIISLGKSLGDVIWWEIRDGAMALHLRRASVSVKFAGSETRHFYAFPYDEREVSK